MSNARGILALDLGIKSGWAYGIPGEQPRYGLWNLGAENSLGRRNSILMNFIADFCTVSRPELIIFESPIAKMQTSARSLIYLAGATETAAEEEGVPVKEELPQTARKLVLGRGAFFVTGPDGRATKDARGKKISDTKPNVMAWARGQGWDPLTHDVADALLLLEYAHVLRRSRTTAGRIAA